jgi:hypothetical protein
MGMRYSIISERPSNTVAISSSEARPSRRPIRSTESVLIWLIFTHDRLGWLVAVSSRVSGNPQFSSVNAIMHSMGYRLIPQKL